ncbi:3-dehydroquinate synthase [Robertkochia sediminum]|uniref:3-dehydroquinate synthase n=1 Tax=Robertkochia sediminum TaxID=2785326 RepID=UPI001934A55E|nr:3-dehydroquinate synthase [Robertkochia sediminum]MBL7473574.1 3-dehydroquinate synthase [Robertkochia sediminum]
MQHTTPAYHRAPVYFTDAYEQLEAYIQSTSPSSVFILVDDQTHQFCLSLFLSKLTKLYETEIIEIPSGEENKHIETCTGVWQALSELGCDRRSLLINLGGGVLTDMGGFIAGTFMRGISFINIPTTLLSMVDASVGGKTGVDLGVLKNQVGLILEPEMVLIDPEYLNTLDPRQLRSGLAEMLKHGLIQDPEYWEELKNMSGLTADDLGRLIAHSVTIKSDVVEKDPKESGWRKILNFGHTLGHAIESYFLKHEERESLLHGEAIAAGMIMEAYLSHKVCGLPLETAQEIKETFIHFFGKVEISDSEMKEILPLLKFDKKNASGAVNFVLLEDIGKPIPDKKAGNDLIFNSLEFYNN